MNLNRDSKEAVQAVREKIQKKFFSDKVVISMSKTNKDKDDIARTKLKEGEVYKDRNDKEWTRENGSLKQLNVRENFANPLFCPKCKRIMGGPESKFHSGCYKKWGYCFNCRLEFEKKIKLEGKWDEYVEEQKRENRKAYLRDIEQVYEEYLMNDKEVEQFVMNGTGELESWIKSQGLSEKQKKSAFEFVQKLKEKVKKEN
tara:strand:+ start:987 stop:1589 length:603 start_codon:yes stop_codon:yes gene_type:complete